MDAFLYASAIGRTHRVSKILPPLHLYITVVSKLAVGEIEAVHRQNIAFNVSPPKITRF